MKLGYKGIKISVTISVDEDVDKFFEKCCHEVIEINGKPIQTETNKNSIYNMAIKYALKNVDKWLLA